MRCSKCSSGKVSVKCTNCSGTGTYSGTCPDCKGTGKKSTTTTKSATTKSTTTTRSTTTTKSSTTGKTTGMPSNSVNNPALVNVSDKLSGNAWQAQSVTKGSNLMNELRSGRALRIEFTTSDPEGYVWICLPGSEIGWTGIGQQYPSIKSSGNKRYVIITYEAVVNAAGPKAKWGSKLYIKGNKDWSVQSISVINWKE